MEKTQIEQELDDAHEVLLLKYKEKAEEHIASNEELKNMDVGLTVTHTFIENTLRQAGRLGFVANLQEMADILNASFSNVAREVMMNAARGEGKPN